MAPSTKEVEFALRDYIQDIVDTDQDHLLTVRYVRNGVEKKLHLDEGFFVTDDWKDKSKQIIKEHSAKVLDTRDIAADKAKAAAAAAKSKPKPTKKEPEPVKKPPKRAAPQAKAQPAKRRKKEATPPSDVSEDEEEPTDATSSASAEEEESAESSFEGSDDSDAPKAKKNSRNKARDPDKRAAKNLKSEYPEESENEISESNEELGDIEDSEASTPPKKVAKTKKAPPKKAGKAKAVLKGKEAMDSKEDSSSEAEAPKKDESKDEKKPVKKSQSPEKAKSTPLPRRKRPKTAISDDDEDEEETKPKVEATGNESDSSAMSVLIDEPPKKSRAKKDKSEIKSRPKGPRKDRDDTEKAAPKVLSIAEQQIKTLQSHLVKCGVRKIWAFELKQYEGDNKAKIKHLEGMLKDIGMTGRFSESRAKEIKELRELQADLEAVKEGEKSWGLESSGRRTRGPRKVLKEISGSDEEDEGGDEDGRKAESPESDDPAARKAARAAKARQAFGFLGDDDEESDSD